MRLRQISLLWTLASLPGTARAALEPPPLGPVASELAERSCRGDRADGVVLRKIMDSRGIHDVQVVPCVGGGATRDKAVAAAAECVATRRSALEPTDEFTGDHARGGRACHVVLLARRLALVEGVVANAAEFSPLTARARLSERARDPLWLLMDPRGRVTELAPRAEAGFSTVQTTLHGGRGTYTLQLLVDAGAGPEVAARALVQVGADPPEEEVSGDEPPGDDPAAQRAAVLEWLRLARARAGLPTLVREASLEKAAASRLETIRGRGRLRHLDAQQGGIVQALAAQPGAPVVARLAEVLAAGPSVRGAVRALLASPAHRRQLQDPSVTHAGVAIARNPQLDEWMVVVALARTVEEAVPAEARQEVLRRLNDERRRRAVAPLVDAPGMLALAQFHAERLAALGRLEDVLPDGRHLSDQVLEKSAAQVATVQLYRVTRPSEVGSTPAVLDPRYGQAAVGVHEGRGVDGLYIVVVLLGR